MERPRQREIYHFSICDNGNVYYHRITGLESWTI
jgi:hypothetical protein